MVNFRLAATFQGPVANHLASHFFNFTFCFFDSAFDLVFVHTCLLRDCEKVYCLHLGEGRDREASPSQPEFAWSSHVRLPDHRSRRTMNSNRWFASSAFSEGRSPRCRRLYFLSRRYCPLLLCYRSRQYYQLHRCIPLRPYLRSPLRLRLPRCFQ